MSRLATLIRGLRDTPWALYGVILAFATLSCGVDAHAILSGCGIVEHWTGAVSGQGQGLTVFDPRDDHWHMLFANDTGNVLNLTGRFAGAALVLTGENFTFDGRYGLHRMSWSPLPNHGFRQLWEFSTDRGFTWQEIFDGRFTPIE